MFNLNRELSKKGFTLIELMVAIVILAIAAIGIFQAFTTSFQAMADAKDRTVATNIAQKKLEEVKNKLVDYPYYNIATQEINDKTYTIIVVTNSIEDNLEKVYVTVSWTNRKGNEKNVQLETLVYDLKTVIIDEPNVGRIHLSADKTEITCCLVGETSTITAELFNTANPEQRVPSGTPVRFYVNSGSVDPEFTVTDTIGKATTQLTLNGKNPTSVTATSGIVSSSDYGSDGAPLVVTCVPKANDIVLSASPSAITPDSSSTITATVNDSCGDVLSDELLDPVVVKFVTLVGSFDENSSILEKNVTTANGIATVDLYMVNSGNVATVTGTITIDGVDISGSTTVFCTDYSISVTANPTSINPGGDNDTSTIAAVLTQAGVGPVLGANIFFATDKGSLSNATDTTDINGKAVVTIDSLSGGDIATVTASYEITPGNTISDTATIQCTEYVINIVANPDKVIPGSPSTITATLTNYEGGPAANKRVDFYSTEGILSDTSVYTNSSGIAVTTLTLDTVGETANVSAEFGFTSDNVSVECIEFVLEISANPASISPGESSVITAILTDYEGQFIIGEDIIFTTDIGTFTETGTTTATVATIAGGAAVVHLTLNIVGTTAIVTAQYDVVEDTVTVECSESIYITLHDPPNIGHWRYYYDYPSYADDSIVFSIDLHGGPLVIDKVKIEWETDYNDYPSRYEYIWIGISGGDLTRIFNKDRPNNGDIETLNLNSPYTLAADQTFEIEVNFTYTIRNKQVIFTLNPDDPNAEDNYQVDFYTPY